MNYVACKLIVFFSVLSHTCSQGLENCVKMYVASLSHFVSLGKPFNLSGTQFLSFKWGNNISQARLLERLRITYVKCIKNEKLPINQSGCRYYVVNVILIFYFFIIVPLIMMMQIMPRLHSWPLPPKSEHKLLRQRRSKLAGL